MERSKVRGVIQRVMHVETQPKDVALQQRNDMVTGLHLEEQRIWSQIVAGDTTPGLHDKRLQAYSDSAELRSRGLQGERSWVVFGRRVKRLSPINY